MFRQSAHLAIACATLAVLVALAGCSRQASTTATALSDCRLKGVETAMRCGSLAVPEDRDATNGAGRTIDIGFAILPAQARRAEPDAIFVFAGGPGQAATDVAGLVHPLFAKLNRERDIVFIDQRGTGRSHRLACRDEMRDRAAVDSVADAFDREDAGDRVARCAVRLSKDADLTRYTTRLAMPDIDAVREHLGYARIDIWGASYGTRAALEYLRQFPDRVRTLTLDGVAPPSQKLPLSMGVDAYAAVVGLIRDCARDAGCAAHYPDLDADVRALFRRLSDAPLSTDVTDPMTGDSHRVVVTADGFASLLRGPLYNSLTASLLPAAVVNATQGRYDALAALNYTVSSGLEDAIALGMHLSVICAEDVATLTDEEIRAARAEAARSVVDGKPNPFALAFVDQYRKLCAHWPVRAPEPVRTVASPSATTTTTTPTMTSTPTPALLLSGGIDPATPPRHADAAMVSLSRARQLVAEHVAHGVSLQGCAPDLVERFIRDADAAKLDGACLAKIPRPPFFVPVVAATRADRAATLP